MLNFSNATLTIVMLNIGTMCRLFQYYKGQLTLTSVPIHLLQIATDSVTPYDLQMMVVTFKAIGKL